MKHLIYRIAIALVAVGLSGAAAFAQQQVKGKVLDSQGEPIIGASVLIKGTTTGTITGTDGTWTLQNVPAGAELIIGTEWKLVDRIRRANPDKTILFPAETPSICVNMAKSTLDKVAWALENWMDGEPVNVVTTEPEVAEGAYRALESLL